MQIEEINKRNRDHMKGLIKHDYDMAWSDESFMDSLLGVLPKVRKTPYDSDAESSIRELEDLLMSYDYTNTDLNDFSSRVYTAINKIKQESPRWYGASIQAFSDFFAMQRSCLISGYGGIGKSYFIYQLEQRLSERGVLHLCIYGKHQKDINQIDFDEIASVAESEQFLIIIDAINEFDKAEQRKIIEQLKTMLTIRGVRIVATYRTHRLDSDIEESLRSIATYIYSFPGVSYEAALDVILRLSTIDVYKYESILYTNNPLYLRILCKALSDKKVIESDLNSVSTLTYILEAYIKTSINKECWSHTKRIAGWMYENGKREVSESVLKKLVDPAEFFVEQMMQQGLLAVYQNEHESYYFFSIDTLTDYLYGRYFLRELQGKSEDDQLKIIKEKRNSFPGMDEVFILALFDLIDDYEKIKRLLSASELLQSFGLETIIHINFDSSKIQRFQDVFRIRDTAGILSYIGGYTNKPYNCVNYLNKYYTDDPGRQFTELSIELSGRYYEGRLKERLKNMIYYVSVSSTQVSDEMLWFSVWCTASSNQEIRCLARKLLYEVVRRDQTFSASITTAWDLFKDPYIVESIIEIFSILPCRNNADVGALFEKCVNSREFYLARSLKMISIARGKPYEYIELEKEDLYVKTDESLPDGLKSLFLQIDIVDKYLMPFRYWNLGTYDHITHFLSAPKTEVKKWNDGLADRFNCVRDGDCQGSFPFERMVMSDFPPQFSLALLDDTSILISFGKCIEEIMTLYGVNLFEQKTQGELFFSDSLYRKIIDISIDIFWGSLMCNYYTEQFASYNNTQCSIGYEVYDPIPYDDERCFFASPIPTYESSIEQMCDKTVSCIERPLQYDRKWSIDADLSIKNILKLLVPVSFKNQCWMLLSAKIRLSGSGRVETYDLHCCTNSDVHLDGSYNDRYLTIELFSFTDCAELYGDCNDKPWLCKSIPQIKGNTDWFDPTNLVFPPAQIIKALNLHYELSTMSWNSEDGEIIIRCDNNKRSYFENEITSSVFIRKDVFDSYVAVTPIHYFAFTEKMLEDVGYTDEASLHLEIQNGSIVSRFYNCEEQRRYFDQNHKCDECPYCFENEQGRDVSIEQSLSV